MIHSLSLYPHTAADTPKHYSYGSIKPNHSMGWYLSSFLVHFQKLHFLSPAEKLCFLPSTSVGILGWQDHQARESRNDLGWKAP